MLDFDLAGLYEVETKASNQAVKRNNKRFPPDFMFRLIPDEWQDMRSLNKPFGHNVFLRLQIETSKTRGVTRYPCASLIKELI